MRLLLLSLLLPSLLGCALPEAVKDAQAARNSQVAPPLVPISGRLALEENPRAQVTDIDQTQSRADQLRARADRLRQETPATP